MISGTFTESDLERASGGRFTDVVLLGQGVTGAVFRARDAHAPAGRWVAVKVSNGAGAPNSALMNEAAVLRHAVLAGYESEWPSQKGQPILCQYYGDVHFAPRVALVMEYLDPQVYIPLDKALEQGHETWTDYQILSILGPFVALLAQAHAAGYVYADISHGKAGHILWNPTTHVVRSYDWGNVVDRRSAADSGAITDVADIVGCGEVLFAMREGPFARLPQNPAAYRHPPSPELSALIRRCLDRQAADCLKSAADLEQAMRAYVTTKDVEVARLGQQFDALSEQFRATSDRTQQDRLAGELQRLREQVERINPWSATLTHMNDVHGRDLDTLKLQNTALAAAEALRVSVQGPQLDMLALEDVSGYLHSYDALLERAPSLPRPPGDRELVGRVAVTLGREKPTPDAYLRTFVTGCTEVKPHYADLLDAVLHGQPTLDRTPLRPLVAYLGQAAHVPLLRLGTRRCVTTLRDRDLAQLTAHLGQLGEGQETVRPLVQKQVAEVARAVDAVEQALVGLQALGGQPVPQVRELPARYEALAQALTTLAALDTSGRDEAHALSQIAASHVATAEAAASAYAEGDFSQARQAVSQLKASDVEALMVEQWARDLATLATLDLAAFQKEFGQVSAASLPERLRDYLQRLGKGLTIDPHHDALRGQRALLADVFLAVWADFERQGRDKPPVPAALAGLLSRFVRALDPPYLRELRGLLEGRAAGDVRNFVGDNVVRVAAVQQAVSAAPSAASLSQAHKDFDAFVNAMVTASSATTPLVKHMAPFLAPSMAASALELARWLFQQGQWQEAQDVYNRISRLGDSDRGRAAAVQAEGDYVRKASQSLGRWNMQASEGVVADLSRLNRPGVDSRLTDTVASVRLDLEDVLRNIRDAGQALRQPLTRWEDFFDRLDACLGRLDAARRGEEKVSLLSARFVGQGLRELGTYLSQYNILLTAVPSGGRWVQRTPDAHLHKLKEDLTGAFRRPTHHGAFEPVYQGLGIAAKDAVRWKSQAAPVAATVAVSQAAADAAATMPLAEAATLSATSNTTPIPQTGVRPRPGAGTPGPTPPGGASGGQGARRWDRTSMVFAAGAVIVIALFAVGLGGWAMRARSASGATATPTSVVAAVGSTSTVTVGPPSLGVVPSRIPPTATMPALVGPAALTGQPTAVTPKPSPPPTTATRTATPTAATPVPGTATAVTGTATSGATTAATGNAAPRATTAATARPPAAGTLPLGGAGGDRLSCAENGMAIPSGQVALLCPLETNARAQDGTTSSLRYQIQAPSGELDYGFIIRFASPRDHDLMLLYVQQANAGSLRALGERTQSETVPRTPDQVEQTVKEGKRVPQFGPTDAGKGGASGQSLRLEVAPVGNGKQTAFRLYMSEKVVAQNWQLDGEWQPALIGLFARNDQDKSIQVRASVEK